MSKKPQYLTPNGFVRMGINPGRDIINDLKKINKNKKSKEKTVPVSKLTPLIPLKGTKNISKENTTPIKQKGISKEAAKAIATAISGMLDIK